MRKSVLTFFFLVSLCVQDINSQNQSLLDSLQKYYSLCRNPSYESSKRLQFALVAKQYSDVIDNDSIRLSVQRQLSYAYFINDSLESYLPLNIENYKLASKLKDTSSITVTSTNLGSYYRYLQQNDSSYYYYSIALNHFKKDEISVTKASTLLTIADIQFEEKAYIDAEEDAIAALSVLSKLPDNEDTYHEYWNVYNLLAYISEANFDKEKTLEYYDKSISYSNRMSNRFEYEIFTQNNKATALRTFGNYEAALEIFYKLIELKDKYNDDEPDFYPSLLVNIAKTKFESGNYNFKETESYLKEAHKIFSKLDFTYGLMATSLELSRLYAKHDNKELAKKFASETLEISNQVSNNEYKMDILIELSKLYEGEKGKSFLRDYIKISDSLQVAERLVRNKFARVKFDTDQIEAENKQISKENFYLLLLSIGLLFTGVLVFIVISQRAKNKELRLIQDQQIANEEIYNLMLGQQDKVEEARAQEKIRVSKELHDGVLGRLFGARLSLDSLNFSEGKEAMLNRANYIGQLKTIEEDIRKISHEMNTDFVAGSGFMDIVSELIENQCTAYGFSYDFDYSNDFSWEFVSNKTKINIYRVIQESLQNIYKHAEAKYVKINIVRVKDNINMYIEDDGKGFDVDKAKRGIGLKNMISRVNDVDGKIAFQSEIGKGTSVKLEIPYKV